MNWEGRYASTAPACLKTNRARAESGIRGGSINLRLRLEHLNRARHLDSCWFAQLEMGDQPLLADRCECLVLWVKLLVILMKSVSRHVDSEF